MRRLFQHARSLWAWLSGVLPGRGVGETGQPRSRSLPGRSSMIGVFEDGLTLARSVLVVVLCVLVVVFVHDLLLGERMVVESLSGHRVRVDESIEDGAATPPLSYYTDPVAGRDLFRAGGAVPGREGSARIAHEDEAEILADIDLLGILIDERPQAVVEDKKTGKTYFLYEGDGFRDMVVEEILVGKVIFTYRGQTLELAL